MGKKKVNSGMFSCFDPCKISLTFNFFPQELQHVLAMEIAKQRIGRQDEN